MFISNTSRYLVKNKKFGVCSYMPRTATLKYCNVRYYLFLIPIATIFVNKQLALS